MFQLVVGERAAGAFPLGLDVRGAQRAEADRPALEDDGADRGLAGLVDGMPLRLRGTVAVAREGGLVVHWDFGGFALHDGIEEASG